MAVNADDLAGPASELELSVERAEGVTRATSDGLFATPALASAAFSDDVLQAGHNSEVIELDETHFVVLRVRSHQQPEVKPLETVRSDIVARIKEEIARDAVAAEAERALFALRGGASVEQFATDNGYQWQVEIGAAS